ncbi:MAG: tail fiber domain-containing protein [Minisyncoccota bacterium]
MNSSLNENLITTKDASDLSGYTPDYLARLVRSEKIIGRRIGHSWLVDKSSLEIFLEQQKSRKIDRAQEVATARAEEYRRHHQLIRSATRNLTAKISEPELGIGHVTWRSHALALSVALAVVVSGANLARTDILPRLADGIAIITQETSTEFRGALDTASSRAASRIDLVDNEMRAVSARVATRNTVVSLQFASPLLAEPDLSFLQMPLEVTRRGSESSVAAAQTAPLASVAAVQAFVRSSYALLTSPSEIASASFHAYLAIGTAAYDGIITSLSAYRALLEQSGTTALALAVTTRDGLATTPHVASVASLALGRAVINASHAAIRADVAMAYGLAAAAPASARATVALIGGAGDVLAGATARVPALAVTTYLRATAAPATLAPALAQTVWGAEYAGAAQFVTGVNAVSDRYLALVETAGRTAYTGAESTRALAASLVHAPVAIEDAYLGMLGKTALAFGSIARAPMPAAAVLAATPTLSTGEQVALTVYDSINSLFNSASDALSVFFAPAPLLVITPKPAPAVTSSSVAPAAPATTTPGAGASSGTRQIVNSYPTYTTVVQGVSQDSMNQSLEVLRNGILATVAGMIQPVALQGATNATTIQYVNMIQNLSDLTVHNGSFLGGTFDGGNLINGIGVSAANGSFTSLTGGATSLGATSVTGDLAITGSASITGSLTIGTTTITGPLTAVGPASLGDIVTAGSFVATSTTATNTFAGSLNVDNGGFIYATTTRNVGIGVLSPAALLAIRNSASGQPIFTASNAAGTEVYRLTNAGFVGLGTSTPDALLSLLQPANGTPMISAYRSTDVAPSGDFINYKSAAGTPLFRVDNSGNITVGNLIDSGVAANSLLYTNSSGQLAAASISAPLSWSAGALSLPQANGSTNGYLSSGDWTTFNGKIGSSTIASLTSNYIPKWSGAAFANSLIYDNGTNVGIGSTSPSTLLSISGSRGTTGQGQLLVSSPSDHAYIQVQTQSPTTKESGYQIIGMGTIGTPDWTIKTAASSSDLQFVSSATNNRLTLQASGNVGIGTVSPADLLDVRGNIGMGQVSNSGTTFTRYIGMNDLGAPGSYAGGAWMNFAGDASNNVSINFQTQEYGIANHAVTIKYNGNVGIGTTGPVNKFEIANTLADPSTSGSAANGYERLVDSAGSRVLDFGVGTANAWLQSRDKNDYSVNYGLLLNPNGGNVGIGTTNPGSNKLAVANNLMVGAQGGSDTTYITGGSGYGSLIQLNYADGVPNVSLAGNGNSYLSANYGNVGIGTTNPALPLTVAGDIRIGASTGLGCVQNFDGTGLVGTCSSDQRLKTVIGNVGNVLDKFSQLQLVTFKWNATAASVYQDNPVAVNTGFIAQQVQAQFPELVSTDSNGYERLNYTALSLYGLEAIKELYAQTGPLTAVLSVGPDVAAQCVVGETKLRRRRKKQSAGIDGDDDFDEIEIKDIVVGDEIQSLDESAGAIVYSRVNALIDMGEQEVYELVTKSGRVIRTTSNHPFLAREGAAKA